MTKEEKKEYNRKWYLANREKHLEQTKKYHQANKEKSKEYYKEYYQANKENYKKYYQDNKEKRLEQRKEYYQANKEKIAEQKKEYRKTPMGRALYLVSAYNQADREANRGQGDLTAEWIVENIFTKKCAYCDKEGWDVIGCNRIDNSKPHTKDNVEPCCFEHNVKLAALDKKLPRKICL